jgi:hypothetical protein
MANGGAESLLSASRDTITENFFHVVGPGILVLSGALVSGPVQRSLAASASLSSAEGLTYAAAAAVAGLLIVALLGFTTQQAFRAVFQPHTTTVERRPVLLFIREHLLSGTAAGRYEERRASMIFEYWLASLEQTEPTLIARSKAVWRLRSGLGTMFAAAVLGLLVFLGSAWLFPPSHGLSWVVLGLGTAGYIFVGLVFYGSLRLQRRLADEFALTMALNGVDGLKAIAARVSELDPESLARVLKPLDPWYGI